MTITLATVAGLIIGIALGAGVAGLASGLYRFLAIAVLLDVKDIPQVGPLQWGWIMVRTARVSQALGPTEYRL